MILRWQSVISIFTCSCLISSASTPASSIGIVMTTGAVQVDGLQVPSSSAIFAGSLVESGDRSASLKFSDGTTAVMRPGAKLSVYREYSVLQHGVTMQSGIDKHPIMANGLKISGAASNAVTLVGVRDASYLEVAAQEGETDVLAPSGELMAKVEPGKTLTFALSQAGADQIAPTGLCGTLAGNYQLTDDVNNVTYQLQGANLASFVGVTIQVTGTVTNAGTTPQILSVTHIKKLSRPCVAPGSQGASPAVVGGSRIGLAGLLIFVGIAGALIGEAAAGGFGVSQPSVTPTTP